MITQNRKVGVTVGRFQVPELTDAHKALLKDLVLLNDTAIVFIGCHAGQNTPSNPLSYDLRKNIVADYLAFLQKEFRLEWVKIIIKPIHDRQNDSEWSEHLDSLIDDMTGKEDDVNLYCSRLGFLESYTGKYNGIRLDIRMPDSGTQIRESLKQLPEIYDVEHRKMFASGMIHQMNNLYRSPFMTVDIGVIDVDPDGNIRLLLGRKKGQSMLRFPGGFVDCSDLSVREAAIRELSEEVPGLDIFRLTEMGVFRIDDWRYAKDGIPIFTHFFMAGKKYDDPIFVFAGDDLAEVDMYRLNEIKVDLEVVPEHRHLISVLVSQQNKISAKKRISSMIVSAFGILFEQFNKPAK